MRGPPKSALLMAFIITIILRAVCLSGVSSAYLPSFRRFPLRGNPCSSSSGRRQRSPSFP